MEVMDISLNFRLNKFKFCQDFTCYGMLCAHLQDNFGAVYCATEIKEK